MGQQGKRISHTQSRKIVRNMPVGPVITFTATVALAIFVAAFVDFGDSAAGFEWREIRIGVWVAKLGLMKPLYDFLATYGPAINTMNYGVYQEGRFHNTAALPPPLTEMDRFSLNLYTLMMPDYSTKDTPLQVLEVGSGRGGGIFHLRHAFPQHTFLGLDLSAPAVHDAVKRFGDYYAVGDAMQLPITGCTKHVVINVESSHNYPVLATFFKEVDRVLVDGGQMGYADIMPSKEVPARVKIIEASGLKILRKTNITSLVLASLESEELNAQKHAMVETNYETIPSWLRLILPKRLFLNLAAVKGSPQHLHFGDGSESYMHFELLGSGSACK
jgi:SAM-dependent methyltransferase